MTRPRPPRSARLLRALIELLPERWAEFLGDQLGELGWLGWPSRRRLAIAQVARAYGLPAGHRLARRCARASFRHAGRVACDYLRIDRLRRAGRHQRLRIAGLEQLQGPAIILTAHLGSYVTLAAGTSLHGLPLTIVTKRFGAYADADWTATFAACGTRVLFNRDSATEILRCLRAGRTLAFIFDQHDRRRGVIVDFFGQPAATFRALAMIAARSGLPVHPAFVRRYDGGRHRAWVGPALPPVAGGPDREAALIAATAGYNRIIEAAIRRNPGQWTWYHRRWKVAAGNDR